MYLATYLTISSFEKSDGLTVFSASSTNLIFSAREDLLRSTDFKAWNGSKDITVCYMLLYFVYCFVTGYGLCC